MKTLTLDLSGEQPRLHVGGKAIAGLAAAVATPGAQVMLLIDPAYVEVLRAQRPALTGEAARLPCPTDGHDATLPPPDAVGSNAHSRGRLGTVSYPRPVRP